MTDVDQSALDEQAAQFEQLGIAFADEAGTAARESAEPQAMYVERAAQCPVVRSEGGTVTLLKMEDILTVNRSHDVETASKYLGSNRKAIPLGLDGPEHTKYRRLLDPVFTARRIAPLEENIRKLANELIDKFVDDGKVNVNQAWCQPLPSTIFISILGLPVEDLESFMRFKNMTLGIGVPKDATPEQLMQLRVEAVDWLQAYFNDSLDTREASGEPGDDMIGWLMTTEVEGDRLTRENILDILGLLMIAGLDTVASSLACMLSYFARHPKDRARVVANPELWRDVVEELMRFESPVTDGGRIAMKDLVLPSGEHIAEGTHMNISWSAANVDPDYFADPLTVDFARKPNPHIAFASGFHRCLGSHLARMELRVALEAFHRRIPNYEIKPGVELEYSGNPRTPLNLPLVWRARSG
jgi:cytochrome P450